MAPSELSVHTGQPSPRTRRSHSISSDRPSMSSYGGGLLSPPSAISPDPAFIAASAASQIVTNDHDSQADIWFDQHGIEPSGETALVAPPALKLVNRFLDQLLFNFLSISRSTSLASLRPAVGEVLKPKLAKDAISGADQELHEYLGGGEEEELLAFHNGLEPSGDWDLELVWKRTRLRCMVYSSLGDMEEEDEDFYTEQEQLDGPPGSNNRFSNNPGVVSPAVAIFLTSILEFMGEQVLVVAGQAAYHRLRSRLEKEQRDGTHTTADTAERIVVEESDMERVALDRTLGRLWRGWKKRIRSPTTSVSIPRSFSRESLQVSRHGSISPEDPNDEDARRPSLAAVLAEHEHAASIPLPITADDIREIEIPGLAHQSDDEDDGDSSEDEEIRPPPRPKSLVFFSHGVQEPAPATSSQPQSPAFLTPRSRKRSNSLPSSAPAPFKASKRQKSSTEISEEDVASTEAEDKDAEEGDESASKTTDVEETNAELDDKGVVAGIITSAAAIGATAIAGLVAAAKGEAPQTELTAADETEIEEDFTEEPQIMTSSRVSINGRISPEDGKELSRRSSVRSHSVHSLRLIDVASPRSPGRSRHGSVDAADYISGRPIVISRPNSVYSPVLSDTQTPRIGSPVSRGPTASPIGRNGSSLSVRLPRNSAGDSISEVEEKELEGEPIPMTAVPADLATATQSVDMDTTPTSQRFSPSDSASEHAPFVLSAPPTPRNAQEITTAPRTEQTPQPTSNSTTGSKVLGAENGAPPLTPLREMMEGAQDTPDESSSLAKSYDTQSVPDHGIDGHSPSASASIIPHAQQVVNQQRSVRSPQTAVNRSPPRSSREEVSRKDGARSQRSIHTSGSGSSSTSQNKLKPVRTSEDSGHNAVENKGQSFEQLIRSDQTIQYTLTPQNMRDIEADDSPRYVAPAIISNGSDVRPMTGRSQASSVSKLTPLHSNPPTETARSIKSAKAFKPVPRPQSNTGSRVRPNAPQARDARVDRDSIGDFAEFIRSTGPVNPYEPVPIRSASTNRGNTSTQRNFSASSSPRTATATSLPKRSESSAGRSRLQARDAVVPRGDSISDLIDFVRSGPQLEKEVHRIPRTVAPFRTTMDSDQMSGAVGGKAIDASLPDPRYSQATASVNSSVTSQSALLNGSKNKPLPTQNRNDFEEEDRMPKRKTRRVRDPYAIDFSDEEDEDDESVSRPNPIQEESLADFLRNVPPPPSPTTTSVFETVQRPGSKSVKKKSSSPSLMSRFGRQPSNPSLPPKPVSNGNDSRPTGTRTAPLYTPIAAKYSTTSPSYEPGGNNSYVSQLDTARNKVVQKSYQPREAVYTSARTNDLADFLLRSEPPSNMQTQPQTFSPTLQKEEASTFQRMFGRKKAH